MTGFPFGRVQTYCKPVVESDINIRVMWWLGGEYTSHAHTIAENVGKEVYHSRPFQPSQPSSSVRFEMSSEREHTQAILAFCWLANEIMARTRVCVVLDCDYILWASNSFAIAAAYIPFNS